MTKRDWYLLGVVIIIAAFLRFFLFTQFPPGLYPDEAMNGNNALEAVKTGNWKVFYPENNGREGLFINIQAFSLMLFGVNEPWALRFPSPIFGTLTVAGIFFLLYELALLSKLRSPAALALLGAFFMATSFWHINFSRIGFRAVMAPFFLVWAGYFLLFSFRRHRMRAAIAAGAALGLGVYTYIAYRIMPALFLALLPAFFRRRAFWHLAAGFMLAALIVAVPLLTYFAMHPADFMGRTSQVSIFSSPSPIGDLLKNVALTVGMLFVYGDTNWRHNIAGAPAVYWPVAALFMLGVAIGWKRRSEFDLLLGAWFLLALAPVVISNEGMPHALRSILMIPPVMGFAAAGGEAAGRWIFEKCGKKFGRLAAILFCGLLAVQAYYAYFIRWAPSPEVANAFAADHVAAGKAINDLAARGNNRDIYVIVGGGVDVRGIPMSSQTVMFITDSFLPQDQIAKKIHYIPVARCGAMCGKSAGGSRYIFRVE